MANDWTVVRLGDLVAIKHGWPFKSELFSDQLTGKPIVVNIGNFRYTGGFRFESTRTREYRGDYPAEFDLSPGDILLVMTCQTPDGEILGVPGRIPSDGRLYLHNQRLGKVVLRSPERVDDRYLYWLFLSPSFNRQLYQSASGTKILHTAPSRIEEVRVRLPALREQRAIADVLDALETKIELNRRLDETLEGIARALFRSWFVNFDPVRAMSEGGETTLPDELLAMFPTSFDVQGSPAIPAGWRSVEFGALMDFVKGRKPRSVAMTASDRLMPVILMETFDGITSGYARRDGMIEASSEDVLMVMDGASSGRVETGHHGLVGSTLAKIVPNASAPGRRLLYYALKNLEPAIRQHVIGTSIPHADKNWIRRQTLVLPTEPGPVQRFETVTDSIRKRMDLAAAENRTLTSLRDKLLPKLLSGEIRVPQTERTAEAVPS
jgi:type I restriction enzyme, S subunit